MGGKLTEDRQFEHESLKGLHDQNQPDHGGGKRDQGRNAALTVARMTLAKQAINPYNWAVRAG